MKISRSALLAIAALSAPGFAAGETAGPQPSSERQQQLRQLLAQDCSTCHGKSLEGDLGPALTAKSLAGKNEDKLVVTILEGHDEKAMPPWHWMLEEREARWLVRYIRGGSASEK